MILNWRQLFSHAAFLSLFHQASKCSVRPWSSVTVTLAGLLSFVSHRALTEASASFPTSKGEELHMGILSHSQGMSIMTKITKKDRNVSVKPLVLTLKTTDPTLMIH